MKYLKRFNESMSESELNRILDKISKSGVESLTKEEKDKLYKFDGNFKDDKADDVMTLNHRGELDINPKYLPGYKETPDKSKEKTPKEKNITPKKSDSKSSSNKSLISYLSDNYDGGKGFIVLNKDKHNTVLLEKYVRDIDRVYYIVFNNIDSFSPVKALELSYNLNRQPKSIHDNSNFTIKDNNGGIIKFSDLDGILRENGLDFGDFNRAWYYIEDNYINR
jgi:hypothetical protein